MCDAERDSYHLSLPGDIWAQVQSRLYVNSAAILRKPTVD
jgi:hypothetical protein